MPQLSFFVPVEVAEALQCEAVAKNKSLPEYLTELVTCEGLNREGSSSWPDGYFERVVGGWKGEPLERLPQGEP